MKLGEVFQSVQAWSNLASLKMEPKAAYHVLKYTKLVLAEYEIAEKQRVALIREITGTADGQDAQIAPGSPEMVIYAERFGAVMETECDLIRCGLSLDSVLDSLAEGESLTAQDLALLEPFFLEG